MGAVYDRVVKLTGSDQSGDTVFNLPFMAVLNLMDKNEIREFVLDYKKMYPSSYQDNISYVLGYVDREYRVLWNDAVGDLVGIIIELNRSEQSLATMFTWIDGQNKVIDFPNKPVQQQGKHQDILSAGFFSR